MLKLSSTSQRRLRYTLSALAVGLILATVNPAVLARDFMVSSKRPTANADRVWLILRRDEDGSLNIGELTFGKGDLIEDQGRRWGGVYSEYVRTYIPFSGRESYHLT